MEILDFGTTSEGYSTRLYILKNESLECRVSDYGSILVNLFVPDQNGVLTDIVLGFDDVSGYEQDTESFGANVGRCANRIGGASFELNGNTYTLDDNDNGNCLHSGLRRYSKRIWTVEDFNDTSITFSLFSPHLDQGFPGNLRMYVTYELMDKSLQITYRGTPDQDTIINMTNHSYFNLNGEGNGDILEHVVTIDAKHFTPNNGKFVPNGVFEEVAVTPMDFTLAKPLGLDIDADFGPTLHGHGYDHNFCINHYDGRIQKAVTVLSKQNGIKMLLCTDYPGIQLYTANWLSNIKGKNGHIYNARDGVCFEPQFFPDSIHRPEFVSPVCRAGEEYHKTITYIFS